MRRVVSVWLPDWPITAWRRSRTRSASPDTQAEAAEAQPFALVDRTGQGVVLHAVDPVARHRFGLFPGQSHADARAIAPGLISAPAEPEEERRALQALALWFERFSPLVAVDDALKEREGLLLDMTGGAHLFGGEQALLDEIVRRLKAAGIRAAVAIADTPGAAFALARWSNRPTFIAPPSRTREALADLPVEALRITDDAVRLLARFGLQRIGDLYNLPRAGLARRFRNDEGLALVRRLDQALGAEAEPLKPERPAPEYRAWQVFAEPLTEPEGVAFALPALAQGLCAELERAGQGARMLALDAFRTDGRVVRLTAGLSAPSRTPRPPAAPVQGQGDRSPRPGLRRRRPDAVGPGRRTAPPAPGRTAGRCAPGRGRRPRRVDRPVAGAVGRRRGAAAAGRAEPPSRTRRTLGRRRSAAPARRRAPAARPPAADVRPARAGGGDGRTARRRPLALHLAPRRPSHRQGARARTPRS
ncbi:MAG: DNA polymerase Y family protein [Caulobacteraceae bacterium]